MELASRVEDLENGMDYMRDKLQELIDLKSEDRQVVSLLSRQLKELRDSVLEGVETTLLGLAQKVGELSALRAAQLACGDRVIGLEKAQAELAEALADTRHAGKLQEGGEGWLLASSVKALRGVQRAVAALGRQRVEDVTATNAQLDAIDAQMRLLSEALASGYRQQTMLPAEGGASRLLDEVRLLKLVKLPQLEENVSFRLEKLADQLGRLRTDLEALQGDAAVQSERAGEGAARSRLLLDLCEESRDANARLLAQVAETRREAAQLREQVAAAQEALAQTSRGSGGSEGLEERLALVRAETDALLERFVRERVAETEELRRSIARFTGLHADQLRLSQQQRALQAAVDSLRAQMLAGPREESGSSNLQALPAELAPQPESKKSTRPERTGSVSEGGAQDAPELGVVAVEGNSVSWRIPGFRRLVDNERNKVSSVQGLHHISLSSPGFAVPVAGRSLQGRFRIFPFGSYQQASGGECSLYVRCEFSGLVVLRFFARDQLFEALEVRFSAARPRDKGRHALCVLDDKLEPDDSLLLGAVFLACVPEEPLAGTSEISQQTQPEV